MNTHIEPLENTYAINYSGQLNINIQLNKNIGLLINNLHTTPRLTRDLEKLANRYHTSVENIMIRYGNDAEFYFNNNTIDKTILENKPPGTQPSVRSNWFYDNTTNSIVWNGYENYNDIEWLNYLINTILKPHGYTLNGSLEWKGNSSDDFGSLNVDNNEIYLIGNKYQTSYKKYITMKESITNSNNMPNILTPNRQISIIREASK